MAILDLDRRPRRRRVRPRRPKDPTIDERLWHIAYDIETLVYQHLIYREYFIWYILRIWYMIYIYIHSTWFLGGSKNKGPEYAPKIVGPILIWTPTKRTPS